MRIKPCLRLIVAVFAFALLSPIAQAQPVPSSASDRATFNTLVAELSTQAARRVARVEAACTFFSQQKEGGFATITAICPGPDGTPVEYALTLKGETAIAPGDGSRVIVGANSVQRITRAPDGTNVGEVLLTTHAASFPE